MTMTLEDRLRDAYQMAARTVRPETIRPGVQHHRAAPARSASRFRRRSSMFAPLAAAAAVLATIGAAIAVPHLVAGSSHRTPATATTAGPISAPPFMAELEGAPGGRQLAIQQAGTKRVTARISPPRGGFAWNAVAATSDTTFIAAATKSSNRTYSSALYRLTLSAAGTLSQLTQLSSGIPGEISALAASQDGRRIAYATIPGISGNLITLSVTTGTTTRHWTASSMGGPGTIGLMPGSLSLTADGSELGFITFRTADTAGPIRAAGAMWLLPVNSAPGSATARAHQVTTGPPSSAPFSTILSADGQTMYVLSIPASMPYSAPPSHSESVTLSAYSTADGALLRTVHTWTGIPDTTATEPSMTLGGSQLLVWSVGGSSAYQVDPASGTTKPVWVYSLHDKYLSADSSSIAW